MPEVPGVLGTEEIRVLEEFCELVVPGSAKIGPVGYIARVVDGMSQAEEDAVRSAIGFVSPSLTPGQLGMLVDTEAFRLLRCLAIDAYYGDFARPGYAGPTAYDEIGFTFPQASQIRKDWSFLTSVADPGESSVDSAEIVVVGSGAGGGLIAAELGERGHDVLLIEAGGLYPAETHTRFEIRARHQLWWPTRFTVPECDHDEPVTLLAGRCVGGTTVINTKVAMRAAGFDIAKFHQQTGLLGEHGKPFTPGDLEPWYSYVEQRLGVRHREDWTPSVHRVSTGFDALDAPLEPVLSYTDYNCSRCGSCTTGCPTNAGKNALNTFIAPALGRGEIRLLQHRTVERLLIDSAKVTGVVCRAPDGSTAEIRAPVVVLAAGSLNTPQILLRTPEYVALDTASTRLAGRTLGLHPARLVYGLFDEPQDCHLVYPITAHSLAHQHDRKGGFVVEGTTIQEPAAFAASLIDGHGKPLSGQSLVHTVRDYRHWAGLLVMVNDENTGTIELNASGTAVISKGFSKIEQRRMAGALKFTVDALMAAGARRVVWSGLTTSHVQGSARMGSEPRRSVVDASGRSHDIAGLYIGDGSLIPASLSVNPSLTIMALAAKVADAIANA